MEEENQNSEKETRDFVLREIFSNYAPAVGEPDYEPTTMELVRNLSETIEISAAELSAYLIHQGFHIKRIGTVFRWQMDIL